MVGKKDSDAGTEFEICDLKAQVHRGGLSGMAEGSVGLLTNN